MDVVVQMLSGTDRGAISGLLYCLGVKCFWACAARAPLWESILRTPGLSGPLALGKAWVTLEAKAGILFWCFLGTVKIGNKICREGQMCPRKFLVIF